MINSIMQIVEKAYGEDGRLRQPKELSINKVGHGKITLKVFYVHSFIIVVFIF